MDHCEKCKWWGADPKYGVPTVPQGWGVCNKQFVPNSEFRVIMLDRQAEGAFVIMTEPDFGCIQWQRKL